MAEFKFDGKALQKAVNAAADKAVRSRVNDLQRLVDRLSSTHAGRPVAEVKTALRSGWRRVTGDGNLTDPQLTTWATAISEGRKIRIEYDGLK